MSDTKVGAVEHRRTAFKEPSDNARGGFGSLACAAADLDVPSTVPGMEPSAPDLNWAC